MNGVSSQVKSSGVCRRLTSHALRRLVFVCTAKKMLRLSLVYVPAMGPRESIGSGHVEGFDKPVLCGERRVSKWPGESLRVSPIGRRLLRWAHSRKAV